MLKFIWIFIFLGLNLASCTTTSHNPDDASQSFSHASTPFENKSYDIAINRLSQYRARFPYAGKIAEAELMIADAHFALEQYDEAAFEYEQFAKLHPAHPKVPYALFQVGECYWRDAPEEIDREQAFTKRALQQWGKLIQLYPGTDYAKLSQEKIKKGLRRVADHEVFIGKFYCKMEIYHSCAQRFLQISEKYSQYPDIALLARTKSAFALEKLLEQKKADNLKQDANLFFKNMSDAQIRAKIEALKAKS